MQRRDVSRLGQPGCDLTWSFFPQLRRLAAERRHGGQPARHFARARQLLADLSRARRLRCEVAHAGGPGGNIARAGHRTDIGLQLACACCTGGPCRSHGAADAMPADLRQPRPRLGRVRLSRGGDLLVIKMLGVVRDHHVVRACGAHRSHRQPVVAPEGNIDLEVAPANLLDLAQMLPALRVDLRADPEFLRRVRHRSPPSSSVRRTAGHDRP